MKLKAICVSVLIEMFLKILKVIGDLIVGFNVGIYKPRSTCWNVHGNLRTAVCTKG